jgi:DNA-binding NarL/FixJ family response regulator
MGKAMSIKMLVCGHNHFLNEGIRNILDQDEDCHVLGVADTTTELNNLIQYKPDVVISDLPSIQEVLDVITDDGKTKVLLVGADSELDAETLKHMINEGLTGILPNDAGGKQLLKAVKKLYEGELWIDRHKMKDVLSHREISEKNFRLTKKEKEILNYVCAGYTNKEVANKMYISEQTVKSHCNHLFKKFGVSNRTKLALYAQKHCQVFINQSLLQ